MPYNSYINLHIVHQSDAKGFFYYINNNEKTISSNMNKNGYSYIYTYKIYDVKYFTVPLIYFCHQRNEKMESILVE